MRAAYALAHKSLSTFRIDYEFPRRPALESTCLKPKILRSVCEAKWSDN